MARLLLYGSAMRFPDSAFTALNLRPEDGFGWPRLLALAVALTALAAGIGLVFAGG